MKFRILGTLLVLAILVGLYVVTQDGSQMQNQQTAPTNDIGLQPLIIN